MARHIDDNGFEYENDILDVIKSNEQVADILELLNMNPWSHRSMMEDDYV